MKRGQVYSVSAVNRFIKDMFSNEYALSVVFVKGEISNCKYHGSGHIYFTLKDASSAIACVMFAGDRRGLGFQLADGQEVVIGGTINVYERDGRYQLYAKKITRSGEGALYEKYEMLKAKLEKKGYFDERVKKALPLYVKRVGIVTAQTGAAIQDMVQISARRNPYVQLVLYPAKVQGDGASDTIAAGIRYLDRLGVDVIIVGRGGGSIEDLWAFNEENTAEAIYECKTPVVSAVGHETDTTIADYVADLRAPTPSAAAELVVYDVKQALEVLYGGRERLIRMLFERVEAARLDLRYREKRLRGYNPENQVLQKRQYVTDLEDKLVRAMESVMNDRKYRLQLLAGRLDGLSPLKRLASGFAYVSDEAGRMVDHAADVKPGDVLKISMQDGTVRAGVIEVSPVSRDNGN